MVTTFAWIVDLKKDSFRNSIIRAMESKEDSTILWRDTHILHFDVNNRVVVTQRQNNDLDSPYMRKLFTAKITFKTMESMLNDDYESITDEPEYL